LPIAEVLVCPEPAPKVNLGDILDDSNENLTGAHLNFQSLQSVLRIVSFLVKRFAAAVKCAPPKCEVCELAKAKRRANNAKTKTKDPERDGLSRKITSVRDC
jgi:hypothetical protein